MPDAESAEVTLRVDGEPHIDEDIRFVLTVGPPMHGSRWPRDWIGAAQRWLKQSELLDTVIPSTSHCTIRETLIAHMPAERFTVDGVTYTIEKE